MKRRVFIIALVVILLAKRFVFNDTHVGKGPFIPPGQNAETPPPSPSPEAAGNTRPTPDARTKPAPTSATPQVDATTQDTLNARYLAALPERLQARASVNFYASGPRAMAAELMLDGVRVEGTDVRFLPHTPVAELPEPVLPPPLSKAATPKLFPERDLSAEAEREIRDTLVSSPLEIETLQFIEKTWQPTQDGLIPCLRYRVDTREKSGRAGDKENWCIDARTAKVVSRNARTRN